jgi:hypothetical protein
VGFDGEVTLGPFTLGGGTYVNPKAVAELAFDRGGKAVRYVKAKSRKLVDNAKRKFADAKRKASDMVDGAKKKLANANGNIKGTTGKNFSVNSKTTMNFPNIVSPITQLASHKKLYQITFLGILSISTNLLNKLMDKA